MPFLIRLLKGEFVRSLAASPLMMPKRVARTSKTTPSGRRTAVQAGDDVLEGNRNARLAGAMECDGVRIRQPWFFSPFSPGPSINVAQRVQRHSISRHRRSKERRVSRMIRYRWDVFTRLSVVLSSLWLSPLLLFSAQILRN